MAWLITHIWIALSIAAILGLMFGFSLRGLTGAARVRRAEVERDVAKTELLQVKTDLDALYTAQRKAKEGTNGDAAATDQDQVAELQAEIAQLKSTAASAPAEASSALSERNTWLEGRVSELETLVSSGEAQTNEAEEQLRLANEDLTKRLTALESELADTKAVAVPAPTAASPEVEEELAKLRWRNRYLEGRLAYFEEKGDVEDDAVSEDANETPEAVETEVSEEPAQSVETAAPVAAAPTLHPSEAVLEQLSPVGDPVQPDTIKQPSGGGDDLTSIAGIGPRISEVLNQLGIWTFQQIADWTPENALWVENHLAFKGRVSREGWVAQATDLSASEAATA